MSLCDASGGVDGTVGSGGEAPVGVGGAVGVPSDVEVGDSMFRLAPFIFLGIAGFGVC